MTGVMVIDTFHVAIVAARQWHWGVRRPSRVFGALGLIDLAFLASNS